MWKLIILIIMLSTTAIAEEKLGILKIFEQFTLVSAASGKCIKPDNNKLASFLANYQLVSIYALKEIKKRKPSLTHKEANKILLAGGKKLTNAVYGVIEKEGCSSAKIQELTKRFHMQAEWKP